VYTTSSRNYGLIFNLSILFDGKVNLVGKLRRANLKFPVIFKNAGKNKKN